MIFYTYYGAGGLVWEASAAVPPNSHRHLVHGWWFDRQIDLLDGQYRFFRDELPILIALAVAFLCLSHGIRRLTNNVCCKNALH